MALPSQFSRTGGGRASRKRRARRRNLFLIVIALFSIAFYFIFFDSNLVSSLKNKNEKASNQVSNEVPLKKQAVVETEETKSVFSAETTLEGAGHNPYDGSNILVDSQKDELSVQNSSKYVSLLNEAEQLFVDKEYVAARLTASNLALDRNLPETIRSAARDIAVEVGKVLTFSPLVLESDPFSIRYEVKMGDNLTSIRNKEKLKTPYGLIRRVNQLVSSDIFPGQTLKLLKGPFRAVVEKKYYRMDIVQGDLDDQVLVASYSVGLGEYNSTPVGLFAVDGDKRIKNPSWTNPRTGQFMGPDNPENPVGEYYIGLRGLEDRTKDLDNYAIHGTIEPDSIGQDASMGCIRLSSDVIPIVFDMLYGTSSTIEVIGK